MSVFHLDVKDLRKYIPEIKVGDEVFLSGKIYTARDAAHKRIAALIDNGSPLPFELDGACIYYAGPTPERPGSVIGSCGPTTSSRMDVFTPPLLDKGLCAMIGKGQRSEEVVKSIAKNNAVYFCAIGGAGALCAMAVKSLKVIAFEELGCESVKELTVENFPVVCGIDCNGNSIFNRD